MNMKMFGFVASLIATIALFLGSTQVQAQGANDQLTVLEYQIDEIGGGDGTGCGGALKGKNHFVSISDAKIITDDVWAILPQAIRDLIPNRLEIEMMATGIVGPWYRTGASFKAWKVGTPGTVAMHRIQMVPFCSHLYLYETEMLYGQNAIQLLLAQRDEHGNPVYKDNGADYAVKLPVNGYPLTGTRMVYRVYNGAAGRRKPENAAIIMPYRHNDPNHRFILNWVKYEETQDLEGWELNQVDTDIHGPGTGTFLVPADAKSVWVVNAEPDGVVNDPVYGLTGNYLSVFNLNTQNWAASARVDVSVSGKSRSVDFDNSRDVAYMPRTTFRTFRAKAAGPTVTNVAMVPDSRLTALVYERTGEVFHLAGSTYGNRVFVWNPKTDTISDFVPATGTVPIVDSNADSHIQGAIFGNQLFRVLAVNNLTQTRVEVYDIPSRAQRATYIINKKMAQDGNIFGRRPEISFDPTGNTLWIATSYDGSLGELNLANGAFTDFPISQEAGLFVGATDVEVDSMRNKLYVSIAKFHVGWWEGVTLPNGSLFEIDLATKQVTRQVVVQAVPWSVAVLPTPTGTFVAVTNSATASSTVSIVNIATFAKVADLPTQKQPTAMAVEFKD